MVVGRTITAGGLTQSRARLDQVKELAGIGLGNHDKVTMGGGIDGDAMNVPLLVEQDDGLWFYSSPEAVEQQLEAVDVAADIYSVFDSLGFPLSLHIRTSAIGDRVLVIPPTDGKGVSESTRLAGEIKTMLIRLQKPLPEEGLSFQELLTYATPFLLIR